MRNLDEINRLLAETEGELAKLNTRRTELLKQITELRQEKISFHHIQENSPQTARLPSVTIQSSQEKKSPFSEICFEVAKMSTPKDLRA